MRRAVRKPGRVAPRCASVRRYAGCLSSRARPYPRASSCNRRGRRRFAVRRVDDLEAARYRCRTVAPLPRSSPAGPTRIGTIRPAAAASTAPASALSSQGCTTMVVADGACLALAIKPIIFRWTCSSFAFRSEVRSLLTPDGLGLRPLPAAFGSRSGLRINTVRMRLQALPSSPSVSRSATSPNSPLALSTFVEQR